VKGSNSDRIMVTAQTVRLVNGKEVDIPGYDVWFKRVTDSDTDKLRFDNKNSPTTAAISPGRFLIWCRMDGKESDHIPFELSEDGQDHRRIDLDAVQQIIRENSMA
jgi:hypothetical protein